MVACLHADLHVFETRTDMRNTATRLFLSGAISEWTQDCESA